MSVFDGKADGNSLVHYGRQNRSDLALCTLRHEGPLSYPDSVQYLYALGNEIKSGAKLGLERMSNLLAGLGHPERSQRFVHVAGTNGKGSTSAMIAAALQNSGLRTGLYTSPHLVEPTERINLNGVAVTRESFAEAFALVHQVAEQMLLAEQLDAHPLLL